tara:strand:- start:278 stop:514 length:237 start_codon:yes stop_codon:yes gene_type:complete
VKENHRMTHESPSVQQSAEYLLARQRLKAALQEGYNALARGDFIDLSSDEGLAAVFAELEAGEGPDHPHTCWPSGASI